MSFDGRTPTDSEFAGIGFSFGPSDISLLRPLLWTDRLYTCCDVLVLVLLSRTTRFCLPGPSQSSAMNGDFIDSHGSLTISVPSWPSTSRSPAGVLPNAHNLPSRADAPCCVVFYLRLLGRIHRGSLTPIMWTYMRLARAFCMCYHSPQRSASVRASIPARRDESSHPPQGGCARWRQSC